MPYAGDRFSTTVYDEVPARPIRFPVKLTYPDNTMFGFAIYDDDPRSDLRLESISCRRGDDGRLVVLASVRNMGADDIYRVPFFTGDMAAFRVAATVTTQAGAQERFEAVRYVRLNVASNAVLALNSTLIPAADVTLRWTFSLLARRHTPTDLAGPGGGVARPHPQRRPPVGGLAPWIARVFPPRGRRASVASTPRRPRRGAIPT